MQEVKILLVEDEEKMRKVINIYLTNEGFTVQEATNGAEALELIAQNNYSLIILDIMLPFVDGWTICKELRKKHTTPVIILTARSEEYDKLLGFELGADDYITKPFSPKEMVARVNALLRRARQAHSTNDNTMKIHSLSIKPNSKQVFLDEQEIIVTPKEFDLLMILVQNPNKVFSREKLVDIVWGYEYYGDLRTVDTHIKQLRAKLKECKIYIQTVWGTGYMFKAGE